MVDIYDEVGYIKEILEHGIDDIKWERDAKLLARFYAGQGMKKSEVKVILKEKCKRTVKNFNEYRDYKRLNKRIDEAYKMEKNGIPLRETREIIISRQILDWFLNLESTFEISDEKIKEEYNNRKVKLSKKPINFNRTKVLFTLYIWTRIQEGYVTVPNVHYLKKYIKRFKDDACVTSNFSVNKELDILGDLRLIKIIFSQKNKNNEKGTIPQFMEDSPEIFKKDIPLEDKIIIKGIDLYKCGDWLAKQKFGFFTCQNCGKEFPFKGKGKGEKKRKYCDDCYKLLYRHKTKIIDGDPTKRICVDCGRTFYVTNENNHKSIRCADCQEKRDKESKQRYRNKQKEKNTNE